MTHDLWSNLNKKMVDYLQSVTLKDLVAQQEQRQVVVLSPFINHNKPAQIAPNKNSSLNVVDAKSVKKEPAPKRFIVNSVFNLAQQN
jgi:Rrf2 family iron-sulfur cluster assembly transcriptional regulator